MFLHFVSLTAAQALVIKQQVHEIFSPFVSVLCDGGMERDRKVHYPLRGEGR